MPTSPTLNFSSFARTDLIVINHQTLAATCVLRRNSQHYRVAFMASTSAHHERSKISWESSETGSSHPSLLSVLNARKSKADTACTRFSLATTNFPSAAPSPKTPLVTFIEPPPQPPQEQRRGSLISTWSLFRSKSGSYSSSKRRQTVHPTAPVEQTKAKRLSRWWPTNRSVSKDEKTERRTAPPIPPRAEPLYPANPLKSNPVVRPVSAHETLRYDRSFDCQPLSPIQERPQPPPRERLVDLDPDKEESGFARIHAEGWDKVIPKQWMEDQFSSAPSETDEERSVYSQDNGEEEAKRQLTSHLTSAVNIHGFLAGEAIPFNPLSDVKVQASSEDRSPDRHVRRSQEQQNRETTRSLFERSLSSSPTNSPVPNWLPSIRPSSDIIPSSPTLRAKPDNRESKLPSEKGVVPDENPRLSAENISTLQTYRKTVSSPKNEKKVKLAHGRDHALLIPPPLTLQPRGASPATTIQTQEGGAIPADEVAPHLQPLVPLSLSSSWSTILCPPDDSVSKVHKPTQNATTTTSPSTRRDSDINKPLPLPPNESTVPQESPVEIQNRARPDSLTDTIDELLDHYHHHSDSDSDKQDNHDESSTPRTSSTATTGSTVQNPSTPPKRPPRTPDTELTLGSSPPLSSSANMPLTLPHGGTSRLVAGYPIFYDAGSYSELGQGRPPVEDGERRRSRRSGRAVVTLVDEMGGTWI